MVNMSGGRLNFLVLLIFMLVFFIVVFQKDSGYTQNIQNIFVVEKTKHQKTINEWYDCMVKDKNVENLTYVDKMVVDCEKVITKDVKIRNFDNSDETKRHVMPVNGSDFEMIMVTLGIGKDTRAEESLKKATKQTIHFYGCDPILETNRDLYSKIGDYFPFAVGAEGGYSNASVYVNGSYMQQNVIHVDLLYFLKDIIHQKFIDVLWMDAEGAEYGLVPMFYRGGLLDQHGIVVCQLNVEVHDIYKPENKAKGDLFFRRLLKDKRYLASKPVTGNHYRWYFINYEDPVCIRRYFPLS